ncbi:MAG: DUF1318 domain-containing protein [Verrucomicrobiota bacterium]
MKKWIIMCLAACFAVFTAESYGMGVEQRLAIIKGLKIKGIVGEGNDGYLKFRGKEVAGNVVAAENAERKKTYSAIAGKQGKSVSEVGRHSALLKADKARSGEWIQGSGGVWKKK